MMQDVLSLIAICDPDLYVTLRCVCKGIQKRNVTLTRVSKSHVEPTIDNRMCWDLDFNIYMVGEEVDVRINVDPDFFSTVFWGPSTPVLPSTNNCNNTVFYTNWVKVIDSQPLTYEDEYNHYFEYVDLYVCIHGKIDYSLPCTYARPDCSTNGTRYYRFDSDYDSQLSD